MTLEVLLHNGSERRIHLDIEKNCNFIPHHLPVNAFTTNELQCPRCKKNTFVLFKERYRHICFCLTTDCLTKDKDASLARKRGETPKESSSETGSQKFRLGKTFENASLSGWIALDDEKKKVKSWFTNTIPFLILTGIPGTGKTYLAAAILNHIYEKKEEILYTKHRRFIEEIHVAMQSDKSQHSVINRYSESKYFIFDDLGSATCSEWQQEMILELIDRRYSNRQKTVIVTNLNKNEMYSKLGKQTAARLLYTENEIMEFLTTDRRSTPGADDDKWWEK